MKLTFRALRADEVEARVSAVKKNGCSILLYKDARCDMNILDETVGSLNWQRHHSRDNANCTVSIWDDEKNQWIEKEDTGTESFAEKEKGLASDSFKRACFNFGIGRELYTAPFIWIPSGKCEILPKQNGGFTCYDRFSVRSMKVKDGKITQVTIWNDSQKKECFSFGSRSIPKEMKPDINASEEIPVEDINNGKINNAKVKTIKATIKNKGLNESSILDYYKKSTFEEMTFEEWNGAMQILSKYKDI